MTTELTVAQALVRFLAAQHDRARRTCGRGSSPGALGIFGHGNVAGLGQALQQYPELLPFHAGPQRAGDGPHRRRLRPPAQPAGRPWPAPRRSDRGRPTWSRGRRWRPSTACPYCCCPATRSPPATRTRCFSSSRSPHDATVSVNDCFRPVSRFYERIERPEQLIPAALEAMRVLTDPAETGAVTLALPEDVQTEAFDWPDAFLGQRVVDRVSPAAGRRGPAPSCRSWSERRTGP